MSLRQIINNHPRIDFAFRSHSSATPIPHCIRGINVDETDRKPSDYADDFIAFAKATKSKYAIPFASSHIYLHELTKKYKIPIIALGSVSYTHLTLPTNREV